MIHVESGKRMIAETPSRFERDSVSANLCLSLPDYGEMPVCDQITRYWNASKSSSVECTQ